MKEPFALGSKGFKTIAIQALTSHLKTEFTVVYTSDMII